jgi:hypothetical protein
MICEKIGLTRLEVLAPKKGLLTKLVTFIPKENAGSVMAALHEAGAGRIGNYDHCSFGVEGTGTFRPNDQADPHIGKAGQQEYVHEVRTEVIFPSYLEKKVISALRAAHPYEEVAYYLTTLNNENQEVGSGMSGFLPQPLEPIEFLKRLKEAMGLRVIRHTPFLDTPVEKVAVCGGAGSFLLSQAIQSGAQAYVSADFKYHEFFDAENRIMIADIGHYESEVFTKDLLVAVLKKKFTTFAINFSSTVTNPISYF